MRVCVLPEYSDRRNFARHLPKAGNGALDVRGEARVARVVFGTLSEECQLLS